jgi:hypothetical protein
MITIDVSRFGMSFFCTRPVPKPLLVRAALIVGLALLGMASSAQAECRQYVETVTVNFTTGDAGVTNFDVRLSRPVSLEHVARAFFDSAQFTRSGPGTSEFRFELLSDGVPVATSGSAWSGSAQPWSLVFHVAAPADTPLTVDTLRCRFEQTSADATAQIRGIHPDDTLKIHFTVGDFEPDGPHPRLNLGHWDDVHLQDTETTPWQTYNLPEPIPADGVRLILKNIAHSMTWSETDISACLQSEVAFDNGVVLAMDDWSSPSTDQAPPPEDHIFAPRSFREIDEETAEMIEGAHATSFRWRFISHGEGWVTFTFSYDAVLVFIVDHVVCPGDVDCSGAVGFGDLLAVLSNWGPCDGCPSDIDGSGDVGFSDLLLLLAAWGPCE